LRKKGKEDMERKICLAYVMGSLRSMYEEELLGEEEVGGDGAMFVIPPRVHADMINEGEDVYRLGKVTPEDVTSILKVVYGEDYDYFEAEGTKLRKRAGKTE